MKIPLYLDIRDIFTDTLNDVLKNKVLKIVLLPFLRFIERRVFCYASHINLISGGFAAYFNQFDQSNYSFFTNGIDDEFIHTDDYTDLLPNSPITITYAGNIGEGQGLHKIIPETAMLLGDKYFFRIIGDGGAKLLLKDAIEQLQLKNISLENPIKRTALIEVFKRSHFLFMHLNDYVAFEKVLPSKVFEIGAFPRPMIAGVNGYSRSFIQQYLTDYILVKPTDSKDLADKIQQYLFKIPQRNLFIKQFSRNKINTEMAASIASYL
jgi:glycosyltransferase involved in cell wall biosynthesis